MASEGPAAAVIVFGAVSPRALPGWYICFGYCGYCPGYHSRDEDTEAWGAGQRPLTWPLPVASSPQPGKEVQEGSGDPRSPALSTPPRERSGQSYAQSCPLCVGSLGRELGLSTPLLAQQGTVQGGGALVGWPSPK